MGVHDDAEVGGFLCRLNECWSDLERHLVDPVSGTADRSNGTADLITCSRTKNFYKQTIISSSRVKSIAQMAIRAAYHRQNLV